MSTTTANLTAEHVESPPHARIELRAGPPLVEFAIRALDVIGASMLLVVLSPLLLLIAIAIRLESPGSAIYRQERIGRGLRPFTVNKFRTMKRDASHDVHRAFVEALLGGEAPQGVTGRPRYKLPQDDRVTHVGHFLRRSSLDELPQLWNVLRGEMSLVGPRPPLQYEVERYRTEWFARFAVRPGVTGLWQVSGRSELSIDQMMDLDREYVRRRSFAFNIWILIRTLPAIISARGAI